MLVRVLLDKEQGLVIVALNDANIGSEFNGGDHGAHPASLPSTGTAGAPSQTIFLTMNEAKNDIK